MKIYTKTGDEGTTALFGGKRVSKADLRIETYGTIDELNAHVGLLRDQEVNRKRQEVLLEVQDRLFTIGSLLAAEPGNQKVKVPKLGDPDVQLLESLIDQMDEGLPVLRFFVLPGGHQAVSVGHIARTVCRRAERLATALNSHEQIEPLILKYLNRLSDFLFVLCRLMAKDLHVNETAWTPRMEGGGGSR